MKLLLAAVAAALLVLLGAAGPAAAEVRTETFRVGPIEVGGYEVKQQQLDFDIPKPAVDGHITFANPISYVLSALDINLAT